MPFALLIVGAALMISVVRNTHAELGKQLVTDFTGEGATSGFLVWLAALALVGMIGYIPKFETPARAFLGLILVAMLIAKKGVFTQFEAAIRGGAVDVKPTPEPELVGPAPIKIIGSGGAGGIGDIVKGATAALSLFGG